MDLIEIKDTLSDAKDYLDSLHKLNRELEQAEEQIITTTTESCNNVEVIFNTILNKITNCLNKRREKLLKQVLEVKHQAILPLKDCQRIVTDKIDNTSQLINLGTQLVKSCTARDLEDFNNKSRLLGTLPEVPDLKEVPFVCFSYEPSTESELVDICTNFGAISRIAPVQICSTVERPGSIFVEWKSTDLDDRAGDIQAFRMQRAYGNVIKQKHLVANFNDCYIGPENQYLVKYLQSDQEYSFRVCCKYEGSSIWSQWSVPQVACTKLPKFSWNPGKNLVLSNENTIAKAEKKSIILYSRGAQVAAEYSVEFTFLECDNNKSDVFVGLSINNSADDVSTLKKNSFLLEAKGDILIEGQIKSTKLPEISNGSKVCFSCDSINDGKLRINVDSNDKRVTYDWFVDDIFEFYFVASLNSNKWKIMVE